MLLYEQVVKSFGLGEEGRARLQDRVPVHLQRQAPDGGVELRPVPHDLRCGHGEEGRGSPRAVGAFGETRGLGNITATPRVGPDEQVERTGLKDEIRFVADLSRSNSSNSPE